MLYGIVKKIEMLELKTHEGKKFKKVEFVCDVTDAKGYVKTLKGSYGEEYARRYFKYCEIETKDLIGKKVGVVLAKRSYEKDGEQHIVQFIRFMNVLDKDGNAIIMPRDNEQPMDF